MSEQEGRVIPKGHKKDCSCFVCRAHRRPDKRWAAAAKANGVTDCGHADCILCNPSSGYNVAMRKWCENKRRQGRLA